MELGRVGERLQAAFALQGWWPAAGPWEVMVGALLVQRTSWASVDHALRALRARGWLNVEGLAAAPLEQLEACLRPTGFYRVKARRLQSLARAIRRDHGTLDSLLGQPTPRLRQVLLGFSGIGPETADAILLYATGAPVPIIDAYTRRILERLGQPLPARYEDAQAALSGALGGRASNLQAFHAGMVEVGRQYCRPTPRCGPCPLRPDCAYGQGHRVGEANAPSIESKVMSPDAPAGP